MFNYARSDTHFLLYVYDNLRNELLEKSEPSEPDGDLINVVLRKSKEESLQRYERPIYDAQGGTGPSGWYNILSHTPALLNPEQFAVFRAVHQWRDTIARQEDESLNTIMPKHVIYNIAREMPIEMAALLGCSQPISPFVRSRAGELLGIVKQARTEGTTGPDLMHTMRTMDLGISKLPDSTATAGQGTLVLIADDRTTPAPTIKGTAKIALYPTPVVEDSTSSRAVESAFWGSTLEQNMTPKGQPRDGPSSADSIFLALPLPQLTAEVFKDQNQKPDIVGPGARAEHAYVKERKPKAEEVFVVKQVGGAKKRKAADIEYQPEPPEPMLAGEVGIIPANGHIGNDELQKISLNGKEGDQTTRDKAERKAQKKLEKKRRKLEEEKSSQKNEMGDEAAFDYANAPSVLHAKEAPHIRSGTKEVFNPYSKSLDVPKGLGRSRKEAPGKSFTFKS